MESQTQQLKNKVNGNCEIENRAMTIWKTKIECVKNEHRNLGIVIRKSENEKTEIEYKAIGMGIEHRILFCSCVRQNSLFGVMFQTF